MDEIDSSLKKNVHLPEMGEAAHDIDKKTSKVRHAGHLVDQKLKHNYPAQRTIFDDLSPEIKGHIEKFEIKCQGIQLTQGEDRLLSAICNLLKYKSEHKNASSNNFYLGNYEINTIVTSGIEEPKLAHLKLTPSELYKEYLNIENEDYSGKHIKDINNALKSLSQKQFLMVYDRIKTIHINGKKENRTDRIELFAPLIKIIKYTKDLTDEEIIQLNKGDEKIRQKKGELIIALNPILTDQINYKYVEYPKDINRRTIIASGGVNFVTQSINTLRDYFIRELSSKRYECQINADKLEYILKLDNYIKQRKRKYIKTAIDKAILACKNLGILLDYTLEQGAEGQPKYIFKLNRKFE